MRKKVPQGKLIALPEVSVVYEKTTADPGAEAVVAIPRDKYYTEGVITLHRVLVRVNNRAIIDAPTGTLFMRDSKGQDRTVDPVLPTQTNWVDYGTGVAPVITPGK
jgi:putative transposon-encoded protein